MRVLISAGEASGDAYGGVLAREILRLSGNQVQIEGIGSAHMQNAGVKLIADSSAWGAISINESLRIIPLAFAGNRGIRAAFKREPKGVFIPIDFGWVNIRLAKAAKAAGWKVLYFIPPGSWKRDRQGKDLPALTDAIVTPFPWSAEMLNKNGANAFFFGHPIKQLNSEILAEMPKREGIAALPGSRTAEFEQLVPLYAQVLRNQQGKVSFPVGKRGSKFLGDNWPQLSGRTADTIIDSSKPGALINCLKQSQAALVCSGTATLEAALAKTPMVITYKLSALTEFESRLIGFKRPKWVGLPNILLDRDVVPEFIQEDATPEKLTAGLTQILENETVRAAQIAAFGELDQLLGAPNAITRAAELTLELLKTTN